jgi:hypothetical protein
MEIQKGAGYPIHPCFPVYLLNHWAIGRFQMKFSKSGCRGFMLGYFLPTILLLLLDIIVFQKVSVTYWWFHLDLGLLLSILFGFFGGLSK